MFASNGWAIFDALFCKDAFGEVFQQERSFERKVVADPTPYQITICHTRVPSKQTSAPCATTDQ